MTLSNILCVLHDQLIRRTNQIAEYYKMHDNTELHILSGQPAYELFVSQTTAVVKGFISQTCQSTTGLTVSDSPR